MFFFVFFFFKELDEIGKKMLGKIESNYSKAPLHFFMQNLDIALSQPW